MFLAVVLNEKKSIRQVGLRAECVQGRCRWMMDDGACMVSKINTSKYVDSMIQSICSYDSIKG